ncbi:MAG TPA: response regulator [Bacillota bacterium]|jgi:CheY-like chemotaxis protein
MALVLVVEDEPNIAMILEEVLGDEGHTVVTAGDGSSALKRLSQAPTPEIALIDLCMPVVSGREVIEAIRSDPGLRGLPVVVISGAVPTPEVLPPKGSYQAYLAKPFSLKSVIETVQGLARAASTVSVPSD